MNYKFSAEKMLKRCRENSDLSPMLDDETVNKIKSLDGKIGTDYNWENVVFGNDLVYLNCGEYVARIDCIPC